MWVDFKSTRPLAVKVFIGGINAISGELMTETFTTLLPRARLLKESKTIQGHIVVNPDRKGQLWLYGIAKLNGKVMQFASVPSGSGHSVEAQVTSADNVGGIQIFITPLK